MYNCSPPAAVLAVEPPPVVDTEVAPREAPAEAAVLLPAEVAVEGMTILLDTGSSGEGGAELVPISASFFSASASTRLHLYMVMSIGPVIHTCTEHARLQLQCCTHFMDCREDTTF